MEGCVWPVRLKPVRTLSGPNVRNPHSFKADSISYTFRHCASLMDEPGYFCRTPGSCNSGCNLSGNRSPGRRRAGGEEYSRRDWCRYGPTDAFRLLYIAQHLATAIAETVIRDRFEGATVRVLTAGEVANWGVTQVHARHPLRLLGTRTNGCFRLDVPTDIIRVKAPDEARKFSQTVFAQTSVDGIIDLSRLTRRTCVAVYDRASKQSSVPTRSTSWRPGWRWLRRASTLGCRCPDGLHALRRGGRRRLIQCANIGALGVEVGMQQTHREAHPAASGADLDQIIRCADDQLSLPTWRSRYRKPTMFAK